MVIGIGQLITGIQQSDAAYRAKRLDNLRLFREYREAFPDASATDMNAFLDETYGPGRYLRAHKPTADAVAKLAERRQKEVAHAEEARARDRTRFQFELSTSLDQAASRAALQHSDPIDAMRFAMESLPADLRPQAQKQWGDGASFTNVIRRRQQEEGLRLAQHMQSLGLTSTRDAQAWLRQNNIPAHIGGLALNVVEKNASLQSQTRLSQFITEVVSMPAITQAFSTGNPDDARQAEAAIRGLASVRGVSVDSGALDQIRTVAASLGAIKGSQEAMALNTRVVEVIRQDPTAQQLAATGQWDVVARYIDSLIPPNIVDPAIRASIADRATEALKGTGAASTDVIRQRQQEEGLRLAQQMQSLGITSTSDAQAWLRQNNIPAHIGILALNVVEKNASFQSQTRLDQFITEVVSMPAITQAFSTGNPDDARQAEAAIRGLASVRGVSVDSGVIDQIRTMAASLGAIKGSQEAMALNTRVVEVIRQDPTAQQLAATGQWDVVARYMDSLIPPNIVDPAIRASIADRATEALKGTGAAVAQQTHQANKRALEQAFGEAFDAAEALRIQHVGGWAKIIASSAGLDPAKGAGQMLVGAIETVGATTGADHDQITAAVATIGADRIKALAADPTGVTRLTSALREAAVTAGASAAPVATRRLEWVEQRVAAVAARPVATSALSKSAEEDAAAATAAVTALRAQIEAGKVSAGTLVQFQRRHRQAVETAIAELVRRLENPASVTGGPAEAAIIQQHIAMMRQSIKEIEAIMPPADPDPAPAAAPTVLDTAPLDYGQKAYP